MCDKFFYIEVQFYGIFYFNVNFCLKMYMKYNFCYKGKVWLILQDICYEENILGELNYVDMYKQIILYLKKF